MNNFALALIAACFSIAVLAWIGISRYEVTTTSNMVAYRLDRLTGEVIYMSPLGSEKISITGAKQ